MALQSGSLRVELFLMFGAPAIAFGALGAPTRSRFGLIGLAILGVASFVATAMYVMAGLPSADLRVHDFERSPLPGLDAAAAGPLVGAFVLARRGRTARRAATSVLAALSFVAASVLAFLATFLAVLGG